MEHTEHDCDICGSANAAEIECLRKYTGGEPLHVCRDCGCVYLRRRRSHKVIADAWSDKLFQTGDVSGSSSVYTAVRPAIKARLVHVLETIDQEVGLAGSRICDIGAGEGVFLDYIQRLGKKAELFGIEPSAANCRLMDERGIANFHGTIEDYLASERVEAGAFDVVTIMWTLENCEDCKAMVRAAWSLLKPGGHIMVATGSRILAPFKKPLNFYIAPGDQDTHSLRFSPNSLSNLFRACGFEPTYINRYIDNDILCMIGQKKDAPLQTPLARDDWREIIAFFERWDKET
ncbi:MAG: class I SAM-dependent methyltransferase, partial [Hyphomicrobiales bacterium]